jgi:hypothetical protein
VDETGEGMPSFARLLEDLFERYRKPNGRPYSNEEVANAIRGTGTHITQSYIWMLRRGDRDDPRGSHIKALAAFFGVPAGYFLDGDVYQSIVDGIRPIPEPRPRPQFMLRRVEAMSSESQQLLSEFVYRLGELEDGQGQGATNTRGCRCAGEDHRCAG